MAKTTRVSGPALVGLMFLFAMLVSLGLWSYWEFHTRPFRPLSDALGERFPGSSPRVEGGKHGLHTQTPRVLRIVMKADFDPREDQPFQERVQAILAVVTEQTDLTAFDQCEIHLFQQLPEQPPQLRSVTIPAEEFPAPSVSR